MRAKQKQNIRIVIFYNLFFNVARASSSIVSNLIIYVCNFFKVNNSLIYCMYYSLDSSKKSIRNT